jgi:hypothetical protein
MDLLVQLKNLITSGIEQWLSELFERKTIRMKGLKRYHLMNQLDTMDLKFHSNQILPSLALEPFKGSGKQFSY